MTIEIAEMIVPGAGREEGTLIAGAARAELSRLYLADAKIGLAWREEIGALTLRLDPRLSCGALGEVIARAIRDRATGPERAR
ncbi:MAG TPA: hypothetical protein VJM15_00870 [Sphingomicrobium sp.]|nr:hypothetical protein [Sphingomicrobium sp.]